MQQRTSKNVFPDATTNEPCFQPIDYVSPRPQCDREPYFVSASRAAPRGGEASV